MVGTTTWRGVLGLVAVAVAVTTGFGPRGGAHPAAGASAVPVAVLGAVEVPGSAPTSRGADRLAATLERLGVEPELAAPGWSFVATGPLPGAVAVTLPRSRRVLVDVTTALDLDPVVAHELGHVVDVDHLDAELRHAWLADRRAPAEVSWWPTGSLDDLSVGAGDFAEAVAVALTGGRGHSRLPGTPPDALEWLAAHGVVLAGMGPSDTPGR